MVAGEASGDLLGGALIGALRDRLGSLSVSGVGGENMRAQGMEPLASMELLSVMGVVEPLGRLPALLRLRRKLRRHFAEHPPAVFIGIDAPDFNLRLERYLRRAGVPTVHYVSPSVWAWRRWRLRRIARAADIVLTLFPFEARFLAARGVRAACVGHPLADLIPFRVDRAGARRALGLPVPAPIVAVLPGSREGEVSRLTGPFFDACLRCLVARPGLRFVIPAANAALYASIRGILAEQTADAAVQSAFVLLRGRSREAIAAADVVLTASGTATLEAMLLKRPMVVAYRMAGLSYAIISRMLRVPHVALPNLIAGQRLVPELLQREAEPGRISRELLALLDDREHCQMLIARFDEMHRQLRCGAAGRAADAVLAVLGRVPEPPP